MRRALGALVLVLASACGGGPTPTGPVIDATTQTGSVTVTATGAVAIDFSGSPKVQFIKSTAARVPESLRFLSVAVPEPQAAGALRFRIGFNLYSYNGASSATIPVIAAGTPSPGFRSIAYLDVTAPSARRFERSAKPCALTFREQARAGELSCPALADASGGLVSVRFTWDLA